MNGLSASANVLTRDRLLLRGLRLIPTAIARHLLFLLRSHPWLADRWGYHIRPIHYYEPLPDFRQITSASLQRRRDSVAIDFHLEAQVALVRRLARTYRGELEALGRDSRSDGFSLANDYFTGLDAAMYYALIRDLKPARVIEIGSGHSTRIAALALQRNRADGRAGELICVEPYPEPRLTEARLEITLVQKPVEELDLEFFAQLEANDILFIDSSHAAKFGGDVCREFLDILPRLKPGVWVHVHDIFFPHDYPADWLIEKRIAFTEQYLLEAFLAFNAGFLVRAANYWLCLDYPEVVHALCPRIASRAGISDEAASG